MSKSKILVVAALYKEIHTVNCPRGLITGIGKTNAALKLSKYLGENPEIERVINFGTACGINYKIGDVIECTEFINCLLYTSPSPRDGLLSRMPSSA